jgi:hypothetical protein
MRCVVIGSCSCDKAAVLNRLPPRAQRARKVDDRSIFGSEQLRAEHMPQSQARGSRLALEVVTHWRCRYNDWRSAARPRGRAATEGLVSCNGRVRQHLGQTSQRRDLHQDPAPASIAACLAAFPCSARPGAQGHCRTRARSPDGLFEFSPLQDRSSSLVSESSKRGLRPGVKSPSRLPMS